MPQTTMPRRVLAAQLAMGVLVLAACDGFDRVAGTRGAGPVPEEGARVEDAPPFDLDLNIHGSLRPDSAITISLTVTARVDAPGTVIRISLPEIESARLTNWASVRPVVGRSLVSAEWRGDLSARASRSITHNVVARLPGVYRVVVSAASPATRQIGSNGLATSDRAHKEEWLAILPEGGYVRSRFGPDLFPQGRALRPGPFEVRESPQLDRHDGNGAVTMSSSTYLDVLAWDINRSQYYYVENTYVWFEERDSYTQSVHGGADGYTDSYGLFPVGCPNSQSYYIVGEVWLQNQYAYINEEYPTQFEIRDCSEAFVYVYTSTDNTQLFWVLSHSANLIQVFFAASRYPVRGVVEATGGPGFYSEEEDAVHIRYDRLWDSDFFFTVGHEYGHAFMSRALGGLPSPRPDCQFHGVAMHLSLGCAYSEGFATYVAVAAYGSQIGSQFQDVETNRFFATTGPGNDGIKDGAQLEWSVASFLFDLTDAASEAHDVVSYPGSYIRDIVSSCRVLEGSWIRENGLDHLVYCLENAVDPQITSSPLYFHARSPDPTAQNEAAPEPPSWNAQNIRRLWKTNLYGEDSP
jgi:hypothetical protein